MLFVVIARDGADDQALKRRMAARPAHIEAFQNGLESGQNILGGALLSEEGQMQGSIMIVDFENRAMLEQWLQNDPYVTGDVWRNIEVLPFKLAGKA